VGVLQREPADPLHARVGHQQFRFRPRSPSAKFCLIVGDESVAHLALAIVVQATAGQAGRDIEDLSRKFHVSLSDQLAIALRDAVLIEPCLHQALQALEPAFQILKALTERKRGGLDNREH